VKPTVEPTKNRSIRVFVSSTFRDMVEERKALMSHTWQALRRFCRERQVEFVEVDLRWGIPEEHSTRKETLKFCLNEIRACRPFFIGLLGERYGWVPGEGAVTADLLEEEPWLHQHRHKSVTELEILHGVLNNPDMAGRAFFYLRDPAYAQAHGTEFLPEDATAAERQRALTGLIRQTCHTKAIPLHENYPDPPQLAKLVLEDLKLAIEADYPKESIPDPLTREAKDHEAFAEVRRRTYIGRPDYVARLDRHAMSDDGPLVLLGQSGSGKSALVANWVAEWRKNYPHDLIIEHYIGSTADSADHWRLMRRLIEEIKRWTGDPEDVPHAHDDLLKTFPVWLAKARSKAEHSHVRCILVIDALNQLADQDRARLLGWLPAHSFAGPLRLIASTLPGDTLQAIEQRGWASLRVEPLTPDERCRMIVAYLGRFSKELDQPRVERLAAAPPAANPLYLKILLDELRVTGTHERLDERLRDYLAAPDIPSLLNNVLARYQRDYERDRPELVSEALGLIWAARRGLSETELLELLHPIDQPQLPMATWAPLRAALEDLLVDRGGILNFAHDYLRSAVESAFVPDEDRRDDARLRLADYFEAQPISPRSCDELPWLLRQIESFTRLRACLLSIERFLEIHNRDEDELMRYWIELGEERTMGQAYLASFDSWAQAGIEGAQIGDVANRVVLFLYAAALYSEAEPLMRRALAIDERSLGSDHPKVATRLNNLASLLQDTNRLEEASSLLRRALVINEQSYGSDDPIVATVLNNLALLLKDTIWLMEAEPLCRRALAIDERSYEADHPNVAIRLNNLASVLHDMSRLPEAESLYRRALGINERSLGPDHPKVATGLNNLALLLKDTNRLAEAEPLYRRALGIDERMLGADHPDVARDLNNLASLLQDTNRLAEAEPLMRRMVDIFLTFTLVTGYPHRHLRPALKNYAGVLLAMGHSQEKVSATLNAICQPYGMSFGKQA
jgi:nephrocystin-3